MGLQYCVLAASHNYVALFPFHLVSYTHNTPTFLVSIISAKLPSSSRHRPNIQTAHSRAVQMPHKKSFMATKYSPPQNENREENNIHLFIPPLHRRRGATAVLVRHKPQWHRHDRRDSTVVPSLIVVAPRKTVKTADLRGGTAATFNMFRGASEILVPSHRGRGSTAVLVRHKPHWHRHDRRGSASNRRSTAENGQHCGPSRGHGGNFEHVQNFRRPPRVGPIRSGIAAAPP